MTKSVLNATSSDVGVETDDIMTARVGLTAGTYMEDADQVRFWDNLVTRDPGAARHPGGSGDELRCPGTAPTTARSRSKAATTATTPRSRSSTS